jgi:pimeloyl-ACP methyl ester carboxylesterase
LLSAAGIPLTMCRDMATLGFENYIRKTTIETGWTKQFVESHPELIERYLQIRMNGIAPLENFLYFVLAMQEHDHSSRWSELQVPTFILVGDDEAKSGHLEASHLLANGIRNSKLFVLPGEGHHYIATNPQRAIELMREFISQ